MKPPVIQALERIYQKHDHPRPSLELWCQNQKRNGGWRLWSISTELGPQLNVPIQGGLHFRFVSTNLPLILEDECGVKQYPPHIEALKAS